MACIAWGNRDELEPAWLRVAARKLRHRHPSHPSTIYNPHSAFHIPQTHNPQRSLPSGAAPPREVSESHHQARGIHCWARSSTLQQDGDPAFQPSIGRCVAMTHPVRVPRAVSL